MFIVIGICIFILGFIFGYVVSSGQIQGVIIVDDGDGKLKVSFDSSNKLVSSKIVKLKVIHGHINDSHK